MAKKTNPTAVKKEKPIKAELKETVEEYWSNNVMANLPAYHKTKTNLASELIIWAKTRTDTAIMEDFYDEHGLTEKTVRRWREECEELKSAHEFAKRRLASFRIKGASNGSLNPGFNKWILPSVWDTAEELNAKEAANKAAAGKDVHQSTHINVIDHANIEGNSDDASDK